MRFSKALINETKAIFKKKHGRRLSDDHAAEYREKLGALGSLACDILASDSPAPGASVTAALTTGGKPVVLSRFESPGAGGTIPVLQYPQTPVEDDNS